MVRTSMDVLPGENIPADLLPIPANPLISLKLGPGLRHVPPSTISPTIAGSLCIENKKNAIWVEKNGGRYIPQVNDLVLAIVHHSSADVFHCAITPYTAFAQLPQLAFEGATKKTRPQLSSGSLIYARVSAASKHFDPEIVCYNPSTGKSEGMGELKGGMVFDLSLGMARRLLMHKQREEGGIAILEEIAEKMPFEIAIGRNGKVWIKSDGIKSDGFKNVLLVGRALQETDQKVLDLDEQTRLVKKLLREI